MTPAEEFQGWRSLLGEHVIVTLSEDDPQAICKGRLLAFDEGGEAQVLDEMGFVHFCWPMLHVEPLRWSVPADGADDEAEMGPQERPDSAE